MIDKEKLFSILIEKDREQFANSANELFVEKLEAHVWDYYHTIEDEMQQKMTSTNANCDEKINKT